MTTAVPVHSGGRLSDFAGTLRMEWIKLRSVRSTYWSLLALVGGIVAIGLLISFTTVSRWGQTTAIERAAFDPTFRSLTGIFLGQMAIGVLGALVITAEYSTGMIRSTFAAVPKRLPVLWAKAGVYSLVGLAVAVPSTLIAFFAGQAFLSSQHIQISFSHSGVPGAVLGSALYLTLVGLLGLGLGAILRNTAAGIAAFAAIMFVVPPLVSILPASTANAIDPYLPSNAGSAIMKIGHQAHSLSPWAGLAVFAGYAALTIAVAALALRRRDV
jgi:ABC-type transport system involved in multi-copper enzyme maturation permease subunit